MSHTPGPWVIRNAPGFTNLLEVISPAYRTECDANHVVCEVRKWQRPAADANAALIAAAPDLLAALKHAEQFIRSACGDSADCYLEAIRKSEGRSE